jgi:hypothetical protein
MRERASPWQPGFARCVYEFGPFRLDASKRLLFPRAGWSGSPRRRSTPSPCWIMAAYDPLLRELRADPRWTGILARMVSP